jgi:hypothetical protein
MLVAVGLVFFLRSTIAGLGACIFRPRRMLILVEFTIGMRADAIPDARALFYQAC